MIFSRVDEVWLQYAVRGSPPEVEQNGPLTPCYCPDIVYVQSRGAERTERSHRTLQRAESIAGYSPATGA